MFFLVQFGINLRLWVFQIDENALAEAARATSAFWKFHSCKLIPNWTRNRIITYTKKENHHCLHYYLFQEYLLLFQVPCMLEKKLKWREIQQLHV